MNFIHRIAVLFLCVLPMFLGGCSGPFKFSDDEYRALGNSTSINRDDGSKETY